MIFSSPKVDAFRSGRWGVKLFWQIAAFFCSSVIVSLAFLTFRAFDKETNGQGDMIRPPFSSVIESSRSTNPIILQTPQLPTPTPRGVSTENTRCGINCWGGLNIKKRGTRKSRTMRPDTLYCERQDRTEDCRGINWIFGGDDNAEGNRVTKKFKKSVLKWQQDQKPSFALFPHCEPPQGSKPRFSEKLKNKKGFFL